MTSTEKLQRELQAAQRTIAELQDKLESRETTHRLTTLELEENRSALLFMLEDIEAGRKKIEQAHQEWVSALDVVDDPIFLHDKEFRILRCNKAYQRCAGIPFDELIGQPYYEVFPKIGAPLSCCLRAMEKAEEEEEVIVGGAIYRSRAFSIKDEQGAYLYSVHTLENITERKRIESDLGVYQTELKMQNEELRQAQIALEESRDQFVDLYEFSPVGYLTLDREGMIDKINLTGATLLGVERNKLLQHRFAPFVATEDRDRWHRHFLDVLQHDGQQRCELALRCSDGSVLHAQLDCLHMKVDGASSVRIALTDITQRKQAEESLKNMAAKYHTMFELSSDAIMLLDEKVFLDCNPATLRMFSCPTRGDFISKHPAEFSPPTQPGGEDSMSLANQRIATAFKNGNNLFEWMHRRLDGADFPAEVLLTVLKLDGKPVLQATVRDITERKQAEQALQQGEADLRALVEHSPIAIIVDVGVDADEKVVMMNRKFTELFGYTLEDVPDVRHWWPLAYPDEQYREALKAEWTGKVEKAIQSHGNIEPMETTVTCKDGTIRQVRISLASIGSRNIVTFEDFTKRKLAESELAEQLDELRRWHNITSGREGRILVLKHEINELLVQAGQPPRYPSAESQDQTEE